METSFVRLIYSVDNRKQYDGVFIYLANAWPVRYRSSIDIFLVKLLNVLHFVSFDADRFPSTTGGVWNIAIIQKFNKPLLLLFCKIVSFFPRFSDWWAILLYRLVGSVFSPSFRMRFFEHLYLNLEPVVADSISGVNFKRYFYFLLCSANFKFL